MDELELATTPDDNMVSQADDEKWNINLANNQFGYGYNFYSSHETRINKETKEIYIHERNIDQTNRKESVGVVGAGGHSREYWQNFTNW